jgi:hypothetical protein
LSAERSANQRRATPAATPVNEQSSWLTSTESNDALLPVRCIGWLDSDRAEVCRCCGANLKPFVVRNLNPIGRPQLRARSHNVCIPAILHDLDEKCREELSLRTDEEVPGRLVQRA